jgi:hypothetical protein
MKFWTSSFLLLLSTFLISCGDNTTTPIISDIKSIKIDNSDMNIYSTDVAKVSATVSYIDGSSADATLDVKWGSDIEVLMYNNKMIWGGTKNGGQSSLTISHADFNDTISVNVYSLTSFDISSDNITTTGEHILEAKGSFENNETNRTIVKNIIWSADNSAVITIENDIVTININSGDTNVTATVFGDINSSSPIAPKSVIYSVK